MSDRWMYKAEICDGHECIANCDECLWKEKVLEAEEEIWSMTRLKPCPFCGGKEEEGYIQVRELYTGIFPNSRYVLCKKCGALVIDTNESHCLLDLYSAWNSRNGDSE